MKFLFLIISFLFSTYVFSTPQIPDILKFNGKEYELHYFSPAYKYFKEKGFTPPEEAVRTTANHGVFLFTYEIFDNQLYLTDVTILVEGEDEFTFMDSKSVFKNYFPNEDKVLMDVNQIVVIPYGKDILTEKYGWSDLHYEKYLIFEFEKGYINKVLDLNHKQYLKESRKQFEKFKETANYRKLKNSREIKEELNNFNEFRPKKLHLTLDPYIESVIFYKLDFIR